MLPNHDTVQLLHVLLPNLHSIINLVRNPGFKINSIILVIKHLLKNNKIHPDWMGTVACYMGGGGNWKNVSPLENWGDLPISRTFRGHPPLWKIEGNLPPWKSERIGKTRENFKLIIFSIPGPLPTPEFAILINPRRRLPKFQALLPENPPWKIPFLNRCIYLQ